MTATSGRFAAAIWALTFVILAIYVVVRMGIWPFWATVQGPNGSVTIPTTFATVDHPFHVARAATLWRELGDGQSLRWVGQHQGGYPVEFYPLGEAWLEVTVRAASLGSLPAEAAHSIAIALIFLAPGLGFLLLGRLDHAPPAVALLALALHVSLPGGWYSGGYTELVQWGLVTNVAGAAAVFLVLPALVLYLREGVWWTLPLAVGLGGFAVYSNPRSLVGLLAVGLGAAVAACWSEPRAPVPLVSRRLLAVGSLTALLAAPELVALLRFGGLYSFVRYSGYATLGDVVAASIAALSLPVLALGLAGMVAALVLGGAMGSRATSVALLIYATSTFLVAFVPAVSHLAVQLEPTRLMPLQRLLLLYLAASVVWEVVRALVLRFAPNRIEFMAIVLAVVALVTMAMLTRPADRPTDPADPAVAAFGLYPVEKSGQPQQFALEQAIREADAVAEQGTALLVIGSALSWHQSLWAPLWTTRPLYYDNWLWFWHPDHAGTPGYEASAGNHYPDPEQTLTPAFLERYGIGAVIVAGPSQRVAATSSLLQHLSSGAYDTYLVRNPVTTVTIGAENSFAASLANQRIAAMAQRPALDGEVRANWFPRWDTGDARIARTRDGQIDLISESPIASLTLTYDLQWQDWAARLMALAGAGILTIATVWTRGRSCSRSTRAER